MNHPKCPKCSGVNVKCKTTVGGFSIYKRLHCEDCSFSGGRVVVYEGEWDKVEHDIIKRFTIENTQDDVRTFINTII